MNGRLLDKEQTAMLNKRDNHLLLKSFLTCIPRFEPR